MSRLRCAIYTRKSSEEGLEQDFNSLDAQREACEAYIKSQAGEGWRPVSSRYDDGGYSGGTMGRPALKRLLVDIEARRVDIVVVYKVDRLTRSLADFARIVDVFDAQNVSFVSVTQAFNTTTSMGRLTLNMLLSFAQFEREVTGERIRDKIAASKKKGLWMGGVVPLGYEVQDRKLVINAQEAKTVRTIFRLYLDQENVARVQREAQRLGLRTKARKPNNGKRPGGAPFTRGHIYKLLANPIYIGEIVHKGERYPGEHEAIIDRETWQAVQSQLERNAVDRHCSTNGRTRSLLTGLLVDAEGERLVPTYATKAGRRYRYYISKSLKGGRSKTPGSGWRLPAPAIEETVLKELRSFLKDRLRLSKALDLAGLPPDRLKTMLSAASRLGNRLSHAGPAVRQKLLREMINQIDVHRERLRITVQARTLRILMGVGERDQDQGARREAELTLDLPVRFKRRGVELKLVMTDESARIPHPDPRLITAIAQANRWFEEIRTGVASSVRDLAKRHGVDRGEVSRVLPLAFLAPHIVAAILQGRQPDELTVPRLTRVGELPVSWDEQRRVLVVQLRHLSPMTFESKQ